MIEKNQFKKICWRFVGMAEKHQFNFSVPSLLLLNVLVTCFLDAIRYFLKYFGLVQLVLV